MDFYLNRLIEGVNQSGTFDFAHSGFTVQPASNSTSLGPAPVPVLEPLYNFSAGFVPYNSLVPTLPYSDLSFDSILRTLESVQLSCPSDAMDTSVDTVDMTAAPHTPTATVTKSASLTNLVDAALAAVAAEGGLGFRAGVPVHHSSNAGDDVGPSLEGREGVDDMDDGNDSSASPTAPPFSEALLSGRATRTTRSVGRTRVRGSAKPSAASHAPRAPVRTGMAGAKRAAAPIGKRRPERDDFETEGEFEEAFARWRVDRDSNNESVKLSRLRAKLRRAELQRESRLHQRETRTVAQQLADLRKDFSLLVKKIATPALLTKREEAIVREVLDVHALVPEGLAACDDGNDDDNHGDEDESNDNDS